MVKVVFVKNPFSPARNRVIKISEASGKPLSFYADEFVKQLPDQEAWIQIDGRKVEATYEEGCRELVKADSMIVIMPKVQKGGKGILGIISVIALSVVSMGIGGLVAGAGWGGLAAATGWAAVGGYMAAAAVMFLGGSLINKLMVPKFDTGKYQSEDPTYSWNGIQTMEGQGNGIALTYGRVKSGGQTIQKFITTDCDDQYFNWLVSAGSGPLTISDIKINDNPIGNYEAVAYEVREGFNNQDIISGFGDTYANKTVSYEIQNAEWRTDEIDSNVAEGIVIEVECSQGLYHANDDGSLGTAWIDITAQYVLKGQTNWTNFVTAERISGAKSGAVRKQFRVDNLPSGKYQVRVMVVARSASVTSPRDGVKIWWTQVNGIIYDDFCYPNVALVGIKAKATSQLSGGQPQLTFIKERKYVWVYLPSTNSYVEKPADNPAWACYDFIHGARRVENIATGGFEYIFDGVPKELMLYEQFAAWAANCDALKLKINIEISCLKDFWTIVNQEMAPVGRGMVVQFGTKFGCIYDHKSQPVQLFNMGNIIQGSFQVGYLSTDDRADAIEITYPDAALDYEKNVLTIYADDYDSIYIPNQPTQLTMNGITDYEQAYREGCYQIMCNRLLQETVTFKADVEAIACMVGDLVLISHDVPQWSISGRIDEVLADGAVVVSVDMDEIKYQPAEYGLMIRSNDKNTLTTYTVTAINGSYGSATIKATTPIEAKVGDLFSLGKVNAVTKPFIITSIQRSGDLEYTVSALEYAEGVFEEDYTIPPPDYSVSGGKAPFTDLQISENIYTDAGGQSAKTLYLTWKGIGIAKIYLSTDGGVTFYLAAETDKNSAAIEVDPFANYVVKIVNSSDTSSNPIQGTVKPSGDKFLPETVTGFRLEGVTWKWNYVDNGYIDYFELRLDSNAGSETNMLDRTFTNQSWKLPGVATGTAYLYIKSRNGQYNTPATYKFALDMPSRPPAPILTPTVDGVAIALGDLPAGCTGYHITITHTINGVAKVYEHDLTVSNMVFYAVTGTVSCKYKIRNNLGYSVESLSAEAEVRILDIPDGSVTSQKLAAEAVTAGKIAAGAITTSKIAAGAVTTTELAAQDIELNGKLAVVGGAVRMDAKGLKVTNSNGCYTMFDNNGITFCDSSGGKFAGIGRLVIGQAKHGDYVRFSNPWDVLPKVIIIPTKMQISAEGYTASNVFWTLYATDISLSGFRICAYSTLGSGSSGLVVLNAPVLHKEWYSGTITGEYTFTPLKKATKATLEFSGRVNGWFTTTTQPGVIPGNPGITTQHYALVKNLQLKIYENDNLINSWSSGNEPVTSISVNGLRMDIIFKEDARLKIVCSAQSDKRHDLQANLQASVALANIIYNVQTDSILSGGEVTFIATDGNTSAYSVEPQEPATTTI